MSCAVVDLDTRRALWQCECCSCPDAAVFAAESIAEAWVVAHLAALPDHCPHLTRVPPAIGTF